MLSLGIYSVLFFTLSQQAMAATGDTPSSPNWWLSPIANCVGSNKPAVYLGFTGDKSLGYKIYRNAGTSDFTPDDAINLVGSRV